MFEQRWRSAVDTVPDRPFLDFEADDGTVTRFSYRQMDDLVAGVAGGLVGRGVDPGCAVHVILTNSVGFVAVWLACSRLGATLVPSDPRASAHELSQHVARTRPQIAVCSSERIQEYRLALETASSGADVVEVRPDDVGLSTLVGPVRSERQPTVLPTTRLAVMFTSGTTSSPKGVELTQSNYSFAGDVMAAAAGLSRHDRQLVVLPLFHANAQFYSIAAAISAGASVALMSAFSASKFVEQARRHEVTHASLFAAPIRMILARTSSGTKPVSLRHAWFAQNLSTAHFAAISELLGCEPRQLYGMTETGPAVLINPPIGSQPAAIGVPALGCSVRVVDADQRPVAPNGTGAIQVGGVPGATIFRAYLDDQETTDSAFVERHADGFVWFDTGDRATIDESGFHYFLGRRTDLLKVGGENVSVVEVEGVLAEHPLVAEVAVVAISDDVLDEVPVAYVVMDDRAVTREDAQLALQSWADHHLAPSKRPRGYHIVDELPHTSVGKVRKFLLAGPTPDPPPPLQEADRPDAVASEISTDHEEGTTPCDGS